MKVSKTRHGLPLVATAVLLLLVLGAIGFVNGSWSEQLSINGTVSTAQIEVKWIVSGTTCNDDDGEKPDGTTTRFLEGDKIIVQVENGYPGYHAKCNYELHNNGTLPVVVGIAVFEPGENLTGCVVTKAGNPPGQTVTLDCNELSVKYIDGVGLLLNQGDVSFSGLNIDIKKGAEPGTSYGFEIQACVAINTKDLCGQGNNGPVGGG